MVEVKPNKHVEENHGAESRQEALTAYIDALEETTVCPACAASAAIYLASSLAVTHLDMNWNDFSAIAREIFDDVSKQIERRKKPN